MQATVSSFLLDQAAFSAHAVGLIDRDAERVGNLRKQVHRGHRRAALVIGNGTTSLFAAPNIATGKVIDRVPRRHRAEEFLAFLYIIEQATFTQLDVHLGTDNYGRRETPSDKVWMARHPRFDAHIMPISDSWLNQVERWFATLTARQILRCTHRSTVELKETIRRHLDANNGNSTPFVWTKTAIEILEGIKRFCLRTSKSPH